jgi:thiamine kinase-like enzyme
MIKHGFKVLHTSTISFEITRNLVYKIHLNHNKSYFLKLYRDDPWGHFKFSKSRFIVISEFLVELSEHLDFVKPPYKILETNLGYIELWPWESIIAKQNKITINENPKYLYKIGQQLRSLHEYGNKTRNPKFKYKNDEIQFVDNELKILSNQLFFKPLPEFLKICLHQNLVKYKTNIPSDIQELISFKIKEWHDSWSEELDRYYYEECTLIHGDLHFDNFLLDKDNLDFKLLFDWDNLRLDHPLIDVLSFLRRIELLDNKDASKAFIDGYFKNFKSNFLTENLIEQLIWGIRLRRTILLISGGNIESIDRIIEGDILPDLEKSGSEKRIAQKILTS